MPIPLLTPINLIDEKIIPARLDNATSGGRLLSVLTYLAVGAGVLLRLFHFLDNRSLWRDELYLAISLVKMGFRQLATQPLAYEQKAPLGFLWAERLSVELFGKGEMALRLFPLLCGVIALVAFVPVARYFLKPWAATLAVALLALASPVIYHSVEAKQYSTELLASILALLLYVRLRRREGLKAMLLWGLGGAALVWFSYSAVFALTGIGASVCLGALRREGWRGPLRYMPAFGLWLCSFAVIYALYLSRYQDSPWLTVFFEKYCRAYLPISISPGTLVKWFFEKANELIKNPLGQTFKFAVASPFSFVILRFIPLLFLVGGMVLMLKKSFFRFSLLAFPILVVLLASSLKLYPFYERLILFLAPMFFLFIVFCAQEIHSFINGRASVKLLLATLLLAPPLYNAVREIYNTDYFLNTEKGREALLHINENYQKGDVVYVYWNMWHVYSYYKEAYNLKFTAVEGKDLKTVSANHTEYVQNLSPAFHQFQGHTRLWYLYDSYLRINIGGFVEDPAWYYDKNYLPGQMLEPTLSRFGQKKQEMFKEKDAVVSLYQLNK